MPVSSRGQDGWFSAIKPGFESPYRYHPHGNVVHAVSLDGFRQNSTETRRSREPVFAGVRLGRHDDLAGDQRRTVDCHENGTFSGDITNLVAVDRARQSPSLVLLDEVGTGTDANQGAAFPTAVVKHFKQRGAPTRSC